MVVAEGLEYVVKLKVTGLMNEWVDGWMGGWIYGWIDGWMD